MRKKSLSSILLLPLLVSCGGFVPSTSADNYTNSGLIINQVYSTGNNTANSAGSHSFIELYNKNETDINLKGFSIQYATIGNDWQKLDLNGTIFAKHSFLIVLSNKVNYKAGLLITEFDIIWNGVQFSNENLKVVLLKSTQKLETNNPFNIDGKGKKTQNYVDMIGAANTTKDIDGGEANFVEGLSEKNAIRRINFADTDNNRNDCEIINYQNTNNAIFQPRSGSFGVWTSLQDEGIKYDLVNNVPAIIINTEGEKNITSKTVYLNCFASIVNSKNNLQNISAEIRARGNSTFYAAEKKSYRIKFNTKQSVFGLPAAKDWTLLANPFDTTLSRNYLAYSLARNISRNNAFQPNSIFLELFLNGEYRGIYLLCDQIEVGKTRVNIEEKSSAIDTGYLLELDETAETEGEENIAWFVADVGTTTRKITIKSPKTDKDYYSVQQLEYIKGYLTDFNNALLAKDDSYLDYIDLDSWIDFFIVQEIFANAEIHAKSVFFYKEKGGKLFMGPVWDFDYSSSNLRSGAGSKSKEENLYMVINGWVAQLMKKTDFKKGMQDRWNEIIDNEIADFLNTKEELTNYLNSFIAREDFKHNRIHTYYDYSLAEGVNGTFQDDLDALYKFLERHIAWFNGYINS